MKGGGGEEGGRNITERNVEGNNKLFESVAEYNMQRSLFLRLPFVVPVDGGAHCFSYTEITILVWA